MLRAAIRAALPSYRKAVYLLRRSLLRLRMKEIGDRVIFIGWPGMNYPENITIGEETTINHFVFLGGRGGIDIGKHVRLSNHCVLETGYLVQDSTDRYHEAKPIVIEDNVWIATGAIVLAGVRVGRNSIVAAGAVVIKDVPADSIAMGVPARAKPLMGKNGNQEAI